MKSKIFFYILVFSLFLMNCKSENHSKGAGADKSGNVVIQLTDATFKKLVFDYTKNKGWKYEGDKPAIIDFYADWCAPCRQLSAIVEDVARNYGDKIAVYKVNTDAEIVLANNMGITDLPALLFIPVKGNPSMHMGLVPKDSLIKSINKFLLTNSN